MTYATEYHCANCDQLLAKVGRFYVVDGINLCEDCCDLLLNEHDCHKSKDDGCKICFDLDEAGYKI